VRLLDLVFDGKRLEFEFNGALVRGICEFETARTLMVSGKVYPKASIKDLRVEGKRIPPFEYRRALEERLKRAVGN